MSPNRTTAAAARLARRRRRRPARAGETLALASRHLDPSLVDVLRDPRLRQAVRLGAGLLPLRRRRPRLPRLPHRRGLRQPRPQPPRRARRAAGDARRGPRRRRADPLLGARRHARRGAHRSACPTRLDAVFFASTGAEAVDSAMKFARAATGRPRFVSCDNSFHGVTLGPLSLVGDEFFKEGFGPLLPGCERVPFGDLDRAGGRAARARTSPRFIVEPIQGRMVTLPPDGYLQAAQELCRRYGTLFVVDEIQTGLGRTGRWFALEHWDLEPDFVLVGKALSGGYMPVAAMVTTREIYQQAVGTLERCYVHQSTYGRNRLSVAAGLADAAHHRARRAGRARRAHRRACCIDGLAELQQRYEMVKEVRASGLMIGIELRAPSSRVARLNWRLIHMASEGLFPQLIVIPLHRDHGVITMAAGKNDVIKLLPPLTLSEREARELPRRARRRARRLPRRRRARTGRSCATSPRRRCCAAARPSARRRRRVATAGARGCAAHDASPTPRHRRPRLTGSRQAARSLARGRLPGHRRERLHRRAPGAAAGERRTRRALPRAREQRHLARCEQPRRRDRRRRPDDAPLAGARRATAASYVLHCGALVSDWATKQEIAADQRRRHAQPARGLRRRVGRALRPLQHDRRLRLSRRARASTRPTPRGALATGTRRPSCEAEAEVRRAAAEHALDAVILRPATVYGPGSTDVVGEIARAIRARNMLLVDRGRAVAGLCYVDNLIDAAVLALDARGRAAATPSTSPTASPSPGGEFTDGLADGLGCDARPLEPALLDGQRPRLLARARLPRAAQHDRPERAAAALAPGRAGARAQTRTSAIAGRARCSAGSRASTTPAGLQATVAWLSSDYLAPT